MDDLISREKAIAELYKMSDNMIKAGHHQMALGVNDSIMLVGELMPTEAVKHGRWIKRTGMMPPEFLGSYECSECHELAPREWYHHKLLLSEFCPNCGARMDGEENG